MFTRIVPACNTKGRIPFISPKLGLTYLLNNSLLMFQNQIIWKYILNCNELQ